jgi:hypothetical protein
VGADEDAQEMARQAVLHGEKVDVDKYASKTQDEYQIVVRMQDLTLIRQHDEKFFQDNAFLQMKKGKDKISQSHVVYEKNPKGSVEDAIFFFSKTTSSGASTVFADETEAQFSLQIADSTVRVAFKPGRWWITLALCCDRFCQNRSLPGTRC